MIYLSKFYNICLFQSFHPCPTHPPISYLINNPRMFNGAILDLAEKPYIPQNFLLQWNCCKCLAGCNRHTYFWPPWRLLEATHHTATAHFGTVGWTEHWVKVPKCAVTVWCLASKSLHGGPKWSSINEISLHISNSRTKPAGLDF